ncbi:MAG: hypothetical protein ACK5N0_08545 [Synechococcaceae cyanobacterium]
MSTLSSSPSSSAKGNTSNSRRHWLSLAKPALGVALAMAALTAGQAQAVVVNVEGKDWDVTTFTGSYNDNESRFNVGEMPWWGSESLASLFAGAVGSSLGAPNGLHATLRSWGPKFSFSACDTTCGYLAQYSVELTSGSPVVTGGLEPKGLDSNGGLPLTWARATPQAAPGPLPALGAAAAYSFSRKLRKRIKCSTNLAASPYGG